MRRFFFLLSLIMLPAAIHAADLRPAITREALKCAAAWQRNDYDGVLAYLPPQVIKQSGGKAAALKKIKTQFSKVREYGIDQMDFSPGQPASPKLQGKWLTALVPLTVVLHRTPLAVTQLTHLLALSADQGKRWYFVPLYQTSQKKLNTWFPEFAGKVIVPSEGEAEFGLAF